MARAGGLVTLVNEQARTRLRNNSRAVAGARDQYRAGAEAALPCSPASRPRRWRAAGGERRRAGRRRRPRLRLPAECCQRPDIRRAESQVGGGGEPVTQADAARHPSFRLKAVERQCLTLGALSGSAARADRRCSAGLAADLRRRGALCRAGRPACRLRPGAQHRYDRGGAGRSSDVEDALIAVNAARTRGSGHAAPRRGCRAQCVASARFLCHSGLHRDLRRCCRTQVTLPPRRTTSPTPRLASRRVAHALWRWAAAGAPSPAAATSAFGVRSHAELSPDPSANAKQRTRGNPSAATMPAPAVVAIELAPIRAAALRVAAAAVVAIALAVLLAGE